MPAKAKARPKSVRQSGTKPVPKQLAKQLTQQLANQRGTQPGKPLLALKRSSPAVLAQKIEAWYLQNRRELPWRINRDPYRIWISEVMLQQTTVTAVIPYYERFLKSFPTLKDLASAPVEQVLQLWTGLGYYSRARNLHKAAMALNSAPWPRSYIELLEKPGFGPYTARAVSSLAFGESVGVLDGNVIRVLSRVWGEPIEHWTTAGRNELQKGADEIAQQGDPSFINQGLMELGATICTPRSPQCLLCPWFENCEARRQMSTDVLPLKIARKAIETWVWVPQIFVRSGKVGGIAGGQDGVQVGLVKNDYAPFLKGQWIFPGRAERRAQKPKQFDLRHGITHHDIYVKVDQGKSPRPKGLQWVQIQDLTNWNPSILLQKALSESRAR